MEVNATTEEYVDGVIFDVTNGLVFIASVAAMVLNITTILALVHLPWSSRPNLRLVLSLCVANFIFSMNFFVYMITYYTNPAGSGYVSTCLLFEVLKCVIYLYIYFNVVSIVLDIYLAVTNPLGYASIVTTGRTNKLLVINAFISLVIASVAIVFNFITLPESKSVHMHESSCSIYPEFMYIRSFNWIFKVSIFISIPVLIVLLIIIFLAVNATNSSANSRQPSNTRGVINVMLVVFAFLVCFGPYQFISFYIQESPNRNRCFAITAQVLERMFYLNAFFSPLIYSSRMADVKKGYTLLFKKCVSAASDYQGVFAGD